LAATVGVNRNRELMMGTFGMLSKAKIKALDAIPKRTRQELMKGINSIEDAYKPSNLTALFDLPFSLLFVGVLFLLSPLLSIIAICFMIAMLLLAILSQYRLRTQIKHLTNISILGNGIFAASNQASDTLRLFDRSTLLLKRWESNTEQFLKQRRLISDDQDALQSRTRILQVLLSIAIYAVVLALQFREN
jgi:ATP-binding cassette subfamily C protein/ATP-binding cassette subfamily C exporter for protease/lipase/ATP-binding cassette subfamily C protein EexD